MNRLLIAGSIMLLQACSNLPVNIKNPPAVEVRYQQALSESNSVKNYPVRWGGTVIEVENRTDESRMQLLYYPLTSYGRPKLDLTPTGRFMAVSKQFLDPAIYVEGTEMTVTGHLAGTVQQSVDQKSVTVPLVEIDDFYVWPQYQPSYYDYGYSYYPYSYKFGYYGFPYFSHRGRYRYYYCR